MSRVSKSMWRGCQLFASALLAAACAAVAFVSVFDVALAEGRTDSGQTPVWRMTGYDSLEPGLDEVLVAQAESGDTRLVVGQSATVTGILSRREVHLDLAGDGVGTNAVYYVVELDAQCTFVSAGSSEPVSEVQVGRVLTGTRTQAPLAPFSEMTDAALEGCVGKAVVASGTVAEYGGTFMWTKVQLQGASVNPAAASDPSSPASTPDAKEMYRLYNPNSGEHFYTANAQERNNLVAAGWMYEGVGWTAPATSNTPVYRLYNPVAGEHHYTPDAAERDSLIAAGWNDEGVGWYSDDAKTVPLFRDYNPNAFANNHNYTASADEHAALAAAGWVDEGIAWYGV